MSRSKVIECDAASQRPEAIETVDDRLGVVDDVSLGDFKDQAAWLEAGLVKDRPDGADEVRLAQLGHCHVDADRDGFGAFDHRPVSRLLAGAAQYPRPELRDQPSLLD